MDVMNILICGPLSGNDQEDWQLFYKIEKMFKKSNLSINGKTKLNFINFLSVIEAHKKTIGTRPEIKLTEGRWRWLWQFKLLIDSLSFCDGVFLMPGWDESYSATIAFLAAKALGKGIMVLGIDKEENLILVILKMPKSADENLDFMDNGFMEAEVAEGDLIDQDDKFTNNQEPEVAADDFDLNEIETAEQLGQEVDHLKEQINSAPVAKWFRKQMTSDDPLEIYPFCLLGPRIKSRLPKWRRPKI